MSTKETSVVVPCCNEEENIGPIAETLVGLFRHELIAYDYELIFIDNDSQGRTRGYLCTLHVEDHKIKAIFNAKNSGQFNSPYYGMLQSTGDATVLIAADFQDPPGTIVRYVAAWEEGYKIAIGTKTHSAESPLMYYLRSFYYKRIRKLSEVDQIEHFTGFGLYDRSFIQILRDIDDPTPFLRGIVAESGYHRKGAPYDQPRHRAGKTNNNLYKLCDVATLLAASYVKFGLCLVTFFDGIALVVSIATVLTYLIMRLLYWDRFQAGLMPLLIGMLFLGAAQIFFIDMVGEYVLTISQRTMKRSLMVEAGRLSSESEDAEGMR